MNKEETNPTQLLEDLVFGINKTKQSLDNLSSRIDGFDNKTNELARASQILDGYTTKLRNLLGSLPIIMEVKISERDQKIFDNIEKRLYLFRTIFFLAIGFLVFGVLNLGYVNKLATNWYKEAILSKKEVLLQIEKDGKVIVDKKYLTDLEENTRMMKEFVKKNPKNSQQLLNFESGYKSRK